MGEDLRSIWHAPSPLWQAIVTLDGYLGPLSRRDGTTLKPEVLPLTRLLNDALKAGMETRPASELVSQSTMGRLVAALIPALTRVLANPQHKIERYHARRHPSRARELDQSCVRWLAQQQGRTMREKLKLQDKIKTVERRYTHDLPQNVLAVTLARRFEELFDVRCPIMDEAQRKALHDTLIRSPLVALRSLPPTQPNNTLIGHGDYSKLWRGWQQWRRFKENFDELCTTRQLELLMLHTSFWAMIIKLFTHHDVALLDLPVCVEGIDECGQFFRVSSYSRGQWRPVKDLDFAILSSDKMTSAQARSASLSMDVEQGKIHFCYKGVITASFLPAEILSVGVPESDTLRGCLELARDFIDCEVRGVGVLPRRADMNEMIAQPVLMWMSGDELITANTAGEVATLQAHGSSHQTLDEGGQIGWLAHYPHLPLLQEPYFNQSLLKPRDASRLREVSLEQIYSLEARRLYMYVLRPDVLSLARESALHHVMRHFAHQIHEIPVSMARCAHATTSSNPQRDTLYFVIDVDGELISITPVYWRQEDGKSYWERHSSLAPAERDDEATTRTFKRRLLEASIPKAWIKQGVSIERLLDMFSLRHFITHKEFVFPIVVNNEPRWYTLQYNAHTFQSSCNAWLEVLQEVLKGWRDHETWIRLRREGSRQDPIILWHGEVFDCFKDYPRGMNAAPSSSLCDSVLGIRQKLEREELVWKDWQPALSLEIVRDGRVRCEQVMEGGVHAYKHARRKTLSLAFPPGVAHMTLSFWLGEGANVPLERAQDICLKRPHDTLQKPLFIELRLSWSGRAAMRDFSVEIIKGRCELASQALLKPRNLLPLYNNLSSQALHAYKRREVYIAPHNWNAQDTDVFDGTLEHFMALIWGTGFYFAKGIPYEMKRLLELLKRRYEDTRNGGDLHAYLRYLLTLAHTDYASYAMLYDELLDCTHPDALLKHNKNKWRGQQTWRWNVLAFAASCVTLDDDKMRQDAIGRLVELARHSDASVRNTAARALGIAFCRDATLSKYIVNDSGWLQSLFFLTERNIRNILSRLPDTPSEEIRKLTSPLENLAYWAILLDHEDAMTHKMLRPGALALRSLGRMLRRIDSMLDHDSKLRASLEALRLPALPDYLGKATPLLYHLQQRMLGSNHHAPIRRTTHEPFHL